MYRKIELASRHINEKVKIGRVHEDAWNETSIELVGAAEAHCRVFLIQTYYDVISEMKDVSEPLKKVLVQLLELYAVYIVLRSTGDLLRVSSNFWLIK